MLGSEEQWSLNRSLNYYAILQLQMFCKRAGKREKITCVKGFPGGSAAKNLPAVQEPQETRVPSLGWEDPLEEGVQPAPVFLPAGSHGQRSLGGCRPEGHKELDTAAVSWHVCTICRGLYALASGEKGVRGLPPFSAEI